MKTLITALCLAVLALPAYAQEKKEPSVAQKKQQARMKDCNANAGERKGDERKAYMSSCLKGEMEKGKAKGTAQQERMKTCNAQAGEKGMKGDDRKKFMSGCLKG